MTTSICIFLIIIKHYEVIVVKVENKVTLTADKRFGNCNAELLPLHDS